MSKVKNWFKQEWNEIKTLLGNVNPLVMTFFILGSLKIMDFQLKKCS